MTKRCDLTSLFFNMSLNVSDISKGQMRHFVHAQWTKSVRHQGKTIVHMRCTRHVLFCLTFSQDRTIMVTTRGDGSSNK